MTTKNRGFKQILSFVMAFIFIIAASPLLVSAQNGEIKANVEISTDIATDAATEKLDENETVQIMTDEDKDSPELSESTGRSTSSINSGVYAIFNPNMNLYARTYTTVGGTYLSQQAFTSAPASAANRHAMFKIIYRSSSDDYVIRSMNNSEVVIYANVGYNSPLTLRLSNVNDGAVPAEKAWKIVPTSDGYYHISCTLNGITYYMCMSASGNLPLTTDKNASGAKWSFHRYTGADFRGWGKMGEWPEHIENGSSATIEAYIYSTVIGENRALMQGNEVDPDVAKATRLSYSAQMTITPKYGGNTKIRIQTNTNSAALGYYYLMSGWDEGCFYIRNQSSGEYLTLLNGTSESELRLTGLPNGADKEYTLWKMVYWSQGYYRIIQDITGDCIYGNNSTSANLIGSAMGDNVWQQNLWKFFPQSDGTFKIQSYYHIINNPNHYISLDNITTKNIRCLENTAHKQLWNIKPLKFNLDVYYDQAFEDKHSAVGVVDVLDHVFGENSIGYSIAESLFDNLGIRFNVEYKSTPSSNFLSYPYEKGCLRQSSSQREQLCLNHSANTSNYTCSTPGQTTEVADCNAGYHHKKWSFYDDNLPTDSSCFPILFTGHAACSSSNNTHIYATPLGYTNAVGGNKIVILNSDYVDSTDDNGARLVLHEMLHVLNVPENAEFYSEAEAARMDCVMGYYRFEPDNKANLIICSYCIEDANLYKYSLINHS